MTRALDGDRQRALVTRAGAELAARLDLATLREVAAHSPDVLVIDLTDVVGAEGADLAARAEAATAASAPAATARAASISTAVSTPVTAALAAFATLGARGAEAGRPALALLARALLT